MESHTQQQQLKCKGGSSPPHSLYLKSNKSVIRSDISNSLAMMSTSILPDHSSATLRDNEHYCNEEQTKIWKKRKRNDIKERNVISLISKAYYKVIFQNSSYPLTIILHIATLLFCIAASQAQQSSFSSSSSPLGSGVKNNNIRL